MFISLKLKHNWPVSTESDSYESRAPHAEAQAQYCVLRPSPSSDRSPRARNLPGTSGSKRGMQKQNQSDCANLSSRIDLRLMK